MRPKALSIFMLLIPAILYRCLVQNESTTSSFLTATSTLQALNSPSIVVHSDSPTATMTAPTIVAQPNFKPEPTLDAGKAFALLRDYLKNNPPCQLPCWWGITPGKSTLMDVRQLLAVFTNISNRTYFGQAGDSWIVGNLDIRYPEGDTEIDIRSAYLALADSETISRISINTQSMPKNPIGRVYGDESYTAVLSAYTMPEILTAYGRPNQIYITAEIYVAEPSAPDYFKIRLTYPDLGIFARYTMPTEIKENTYEFCPSDSLIDLELIPQGFGDNYQEFFRELGNDEWASFPNSPYDKSAEEAIGMTNEEFYELFRFSTSQCLESPISIWPEP